MTKPTPYEVCVQVLTKKPDASFQDVTKSIARRCGPRAKLYPISYGRAKLQLGLIDKPKRKRSKSTTDTRREEAERMNATTAEAADAIAVVLRVLEEQGAEILKLREQLSRISNDAAAAVG